MWKWRSPECQAPFVPDAVDASVHATMHAFRPPVGLGPMEGSVLSMWSQLKFMRKTAPRQSRQVVDTSGGIGPDASPIPK